MTKYRDSSEQQSAPDAKVLNDIKRVGWHTLGVSPTMGEDGPNWAFSIGLYQTFGHPEVIVLGLPVGTRQQLVNVIGTHVKEGKRYIADNNYAAAPSARRAKSPLLRIFPLPDLHRLL
jgi:hypothetical protein